MGLGGHTAAALVLAATFVASFGWAQPAPPNEAARLFERGKSLFDSKQYVQACEALATSDRLEPSVGALGLLAACHEALGLKGTALKEYRETAARARKAGDDRAAYALERATRLEPQVAHLTIRSIGDETDLRVELDGAPGRLGEEIVDEGKHVVAASAPGRAAWRTEVLVGSREAAVVTIPALADGAASPVPWTVPTVGARPEAQPPTADTGESRRTLALVVGGVGVLGFVAAGVTGAMVLAKNDIVERDCPGATCRTQEGYDAAQAGKTLIVVNAVAWGVGAVGAGAGAYLFFSSPSGAGARRSATSGAGVVARPGGAALAWAGQF